MVVEEVKQQKSGSGGITTASFLYMFSFEVEREKQT